MIPDFNPSASTARVFRGPLMYFSIPPKSPNIAVFFASFSQKSVSNPDFSPASRLKVLINDSAVVNFVASHRVFQSRDVLSVLSSLFAHWRTVPDFARV